jgi:hypothetical protein
MQNKAITMATIITNAAMQNQTIKNLQGLIHAVDALVSTVHGSLVNCWFGYLMFFDINNCPELDSVWNSM